MIFFVDVCERYLFEYVYTYTQIPCAKKLDSEILPLYLSASFPPYFGACSNLTPKFICVGEYHFNFEIEPFPFVLGVDDDTWSGSVGSWSAWTYIMNKVKINVIMLESILVELGKRTSASDSVAFSSVHSRC